MNFSCPNMFFLFIGALLQAAVTSVEDHGYVMDVGIPNIRAFLPKDSANPEIELGKFYYSYYKFTFLMIVLVWQECRWPQ